MGIALKPRRYCPTIRVLVTFAAFLAVAEPSAAQTNRSEFKSTTREAALAYQRFIEDGARFNSLGDLRNAEAAYRRAVVTCQSHYGENASLCGNALNRLGLEMSNQGRFEDADNVFGTANILAQNSASPFDIPRYLVYRAMDTSNRENFDRARLLILTANKRYSVLIKAAINATGSGEVDAKQRLNSILLEFAHGLYVHAGIAQRLGKMDEAKLSVRLAKDVTEKVGNAPRGLQNGLDKVLEIAPPPSLQFWPKPEDVSETD